ncbi:MAG TPA: S8 family serine peptidase [Pyrinomonadaceae bacterium]|nr:S8 family serine peptidase [Pyrinomonadaceae bacterium]
MNRQNFVGHLALALMFVVAAAFVGQIQRWEWRRAAAPRTAEVARPAEAPASRGAAFAREASEPELLVRFSPGVPLEKIKELSLMLGGRVEDEIESVGGLVSIDSAYGDGASDWFARKFRELPEVEYVEPNETIWLNPRPAGSIAERFVSAPAAGPNDPLFAEQWALTNSGARGGREKADISALGAWAKTQGSREVVVAVLDSGVDYTHPDLAGNIWQRPASLAPYFDDELGEVDDFRGFSALEDLRDPMDDNGHGTHCAGIVGAEGDNGLGIAGVNWEVEIMPLKFIGKGGFGSTKDAVEAINYVIQRKRDGVNVRVISASWGSRQKSRALEDVIRKAGEEGILFVAAAGNNGEDADRFPHYPSNYDLPNVVSVAAMTRVDELAAFSNYGAKTVHLAAPGAEILSTWLGDGFEEHSGTSMATPVVSGVAALVLSVEPNLSVRELRQRLLDTVDKLDALRGKVSSGGRVNAARAVGAR